MQQNITAMDGEAESCKRWRSCRVLPDTYELDFEDLLH